MIVINDSRMKQHSGTKTKRKQLNPIQTKTKQSNHSIAQKQQLLCCITIDIVSKSNIYKNYPF